MLLLSYIQDITFLKKDKNANLVIKTNGGVNSWNFNFDSKSLELIQPLFRQETNILSCLEKGKSSKEIANELCISSHTIDTHRRNLLKKTNCRDMTRLVVGLALMGHWQ